MNGCQLGEKLDLRLGRVSGQGKETAEAVALVKGGGTDLSPGRVKNKGK